MIELPDFAPLRVTQDAGKPGKKHYDALDHLAVIVPWTSSADPLRGVPQARQLKTLLDRAKGGKDRLVSTHLTNARATGVTAAAFRPAEAFRRLSWARRVIAECLRGKPRKLGVLVAGLDAEAAEAVLRALVAAAAAAAFELATFKSGKHGSKTLRTLQILGTERVDFGVELAEGLGNNIARWFTALPPNVLTSRSYKSAVQQIAKQHSLGFEFLSETQLAKLGAGAFLAVAQGNADRDAGIFHVKYRPAKKVRQPDLALVGKGILFDTGGNNLKPFKGMLDMHTDMQGSAVALGTIVALAAIGAPYAVDAWLAVTENRLSADAYKSQDVVTAVNGTTIQVIHTDAEGRMVLADTLALAAREKPKLMLDYATLTGACVAALTDRYSGVFSNRSMANALMTDIGVASGERVWPFPMDDDYEDALRSETADVKQCAADGYGDHILAARFLKRFVPDSIPWVHMDLSSSSVKGGLAHVPTEITGFGVRFTVELLRALGSPEAVAKKLDS